MKTLPSLKAVHQEIIERDKPFEQVAASFADDIGTVLLLSGSDLDCSRYHILAAKPWLEAVRCQGEVSIQYQANLFQHFESGFSGDAYSLFLDLFERNSAPFFRYIHANDHKIVSTSLQRFIKQQGRQVETRPIKGTIARAGHKSRKKGSVPCSMNTCLMGRSIKIKNRSCLKFNGNRYTLL